jgi:hypothetical protein
LCQSLCFFTKSAGLYKKHAINVADPTRRAHPRAPIPLYETVFPSEGLAVVVLVVEVVELALVAVEDTDEVADAGRLERTGSAVNEAERPVTLVQIEGTLGCVPATKLTTAHYAVSIFRRQWIGSAYLVEDAIGSILYNANNALFTHE